MAVIGPTELAVQCDALPSDGGVSGGCIWQ